MHAGAQKYVKLFLKIFFFNFAQNHLSMLTINDIDTQYISVMRYVLAHSTLIIIKDPRVSFCEVSCSGIAFHFIILGPPPCSINLTLFIVREDESKVTISLSWRNCSKIFFVKLNDCITNETVSLKSTSLPIQLNLSVGGQYTLRVLCIY